jgi:tripartite-type tricarboxylate transporter receptor subunit TctC
MIVPFPPAGDVGFVARLMGHWLTDRLGQPFVIENRPGAGTNIGTEAVVRAAADGYTLLVVSLPSTVNATLYPNLNFNFIRDIAPVAPVIRAPFVMVAHPSVPAGTIPELIAYAKANPNKIAMASAGVGTGPHLAGQLFKMMADVSMTHVSYRGVAPDLLGGQVQLGFGGVPTTIEQIRAGKLRALAVTTASRTEALPDVPSLGEFLPGYEVSFWGGIGAPKNTPADVVDTLNREINAALADSKIKARLAEMGGMMMAGLPADFGRFISHETEKWAKLIRVAGIKAE